MNRKKNNLYDHIIVTCGGHLKGIVSVQTLLEMLTRMRVEMAKGANPLTGLPGNLAIENELRRRQNTKEPHAVVFVDLDHFKSLNDRYGFEAGDEVILFTARLLKALLNKYVPEKNFLGHIGGDDFIFIISVDAAENICRKTIRHFDYLIKRFYQPHDLNEGKILCVDRDGEKKWIPIVSISMVIIDIRGGSGSDLKAISTHIAQLKKYAKSLPGSVFVRDRREKDKSAASD